MVIFMAKILITNPVHEECIHILRKAGFIVDTAYGVSQEELIKVIGDYDALIVRGRTKVTKEVLAAAANLKVVGRAGVGLDNIDVEEARKRGVEVVYTPQASTIAVAELTIGLMLSLLRKLPYADRNLKDGRWEKPRLHGFELKGKTVGIVGFGRIGRAVAKRVLAFEARVIAYDVADIKALAQELGVEVVSSLEELLREADIVSIHVPLLPETRQLIDEKAIYTMKKGAYLINTSRGEVVDTKALLKALKEGHLAGAALDVFEHEPPAEDWEWELVKHPNVVVTPHIGAQTAEAQRAAAIQVAESIIKALSHRM